MLALHIFHQSSRHTCSIDNGEVTRDDTLYTKSLSDRNRTVIIDLININKQTIPYAYHN
jgi:hypothetical protein